MQGMDIIMEITCIGLDYNSAGVELRGRVAFTESRYEKAYSHFIASAGIEGCIILSTCNRTEIYICSRDSRLANTAAYGFLRGFFDLRESDFRHFFELSGESAILHLFRVASGLESMVIGEDQILSQVKEAQRRANEYDAAGSMLNRIFRDAITCAKEIKHCTAISQNKLSVASLAVDAVCRRSGPLNGKKAMVVGVGEMSRLAIKNLQDKGINDIILVNRTRHNARELLAGNDNIVFVEYDRRYEYLSEIDIVITSTAAPHLVFEYEKIKNSYKGREIVMVDLAVPRDIEDKAAGLSGITLIDMDYLQMLSQQNAELRKELSVEAERMIEHSMEKLNEWLEDADLHMLLSKIDGYVESDVAMQAEALLYKEGYEGRHYQYELKDYGLSLANRTLKKLALKIKSMPQEKSGDYVRMLEELLDAGMPHPRV